MSQNMVAYSFFSEHPKHFFYVEKKLAFISGGGAAGMSA